MKKMQIIPKEKIGHDLNLSFSTVELTTPNLTSRDLIRELEKNLGLSRGRLKPAGEGDRAHQAEKGLSIYSGMPTWGVRFPLNPFILQVLCYLELAPGQLSGMAWCYLNSFAYIFEEHKAAFADCPLNVPTLPVFMHYFSFIPDKSWVTVRKRRDLFHSINKLERNYDKFVFLPWTPDTLHLDLGWREFIDEDWKNKIFIPGRADLHPWEKEVIFRIEQIREGKILFNQFCLFELIFNNVTSYSQV